MYCNKSQHKYFRSFPKGMPASFPLRTPDTAGPSTLRILHASPEMPAVDVYIDGEQVLRNFNYKSSSTYFSLSSGQHQIDLYPAGEVRTPLISKKVFNQAGKFYTIAVAGRSENFRILTFEDQHEVPSKEAKIRFIHLSPDAPDIDIAVKNRDVVFQKIPYRKSTSYLGVTPMVLSLEARMTGTNEVIFPLPTIKLKPDKAYSGVIVGLVNGEGPLEIILLHG